MDQCGNHLKEYISLIDHEERLKKALADNSKYYNDLLAQKDVEFLNLRDKLIQRYSRADIFLEVLGQRALQAAREKNVTLDQRWLRKQIDLDNLDSPIIQQMDALLQMGIDFEVLLKTIRQDETLNHQWKNILMIMRLSGYDTFDRQKDI